MEAVVRRLKTDLHNCVGYIQDPKLLKDSIKAMYQKHVHEDTVSELHTWGRRVQVESWGEAGGWAGPPPATWIAPPADHLITGLHSPWVY